MHIKTRHQDMLALALAVAAATVVFELWPRLDIAVSSRFFDGTAFVGGTWAWANWVYHEVPRLGSALVLGSAVCYALYMAGSGPMIARLGAMRFTALAMLVSTFATGLHFALTADVSELLQPWPVYGWALAMALIATVIPVFAQSAAIRRLGSGRTAMFAMLGPILTIGIGAWWLAEPVSVAQLIGAGLVIAGLLIVSRERAG